MNKKILILGAGTIQTPIIVKAKELGLFTIVVDYDQSAPGGKIADVFYPVSTNDYDKILCIAKKCKIDGILTTSDFPVNIVAQVASLLNLPSMGVDLARLCTNKYLQRMHLDKHGIIVPKFVKIEFIEDLQSINFFPCVMKPIDSSASRGVKKIYNKEELLAQFHISQGFSNCGSVIVEEFISGREFSVETLTQNKQTEIIQITEKLTIGEDCGFFVEDTHIVPARISQEETNQIKKSIKYIFELLNVDNCPTHTEIKLHNNQLFIVEIACRLGGDFITSDLVPLSTGVDMLKELIYLSLGYPIDTQKKYNKVAAIQFLNTENYTKCINFIHENESLIVRSEVNPYSQKTISNSNDRLGYIILNTLDMSSMENLLSKIK